MLMFIYYIFSLIFVQGCITHLGSVKEEDHNPAEFAQIMKYFGSVQESILALIQATTGGNDWHVIYDAVSITGPTNSMLFLFFMGFFHIAVLNVLTGIFVENAMKLAQPDPFTAALQQRQNEMLEAEELKEVCRGLQGTESGTISLEDFQREIHHGKLRTHLRVLGLDIKDTHKFFSILSFASGQEKVDIDMFVNGCMKLKGYATAIDLQSLLCETRQTTKDIQRLLDKACAGLSTTNVGWGSEMRIEEDGSEESGSQMRILQTLNQDEDEMADRVGEMAPGRSSPSKEVGMKVVRSSALSL